MHYIDCHVHIDFYDKPDEIMRLYEINKIYAIFVTNLPELYQKHLPKVRDYKFIRLALGFHPELVIQYDFNYSLFKDYLPSTNYIGEVGLDFTIKQKFYREKQLRLLEFITQRKFNKGRVYSIHSKGCEKEVMRILTNNKVKSAIFHWYSGSVKDLHNIVEHGYYFSINPNMIRSKKGKSLILTIPIDKLLFETDGPLCKINRNLITPSLIPQAYKEISHLLGINFRDIAYVNFKKLLIQANLERAK